MSVTDTTVAAQTDSKTRVACVGDSITYGAGVAGRESNSYPAVLGKLLGDKYEVKNFGVSGATLLKKGDNPYWRQGAFKKATDFKPNIVVIKLGTNDTKPQNRTNHMDEFATDVGQQDIVGEKHQRARVEATMKAGEEFGDPAPRDVREPKIRQAGIKRTGNLFEGIGVAGQPRYLVHVQVLRTRQREHFRSGVQGDNSFGNPGQALGPVTRTAGDLQNATAAKERLLQRGHGRQFALPHRIVAAIHLLVLRRAQAVVFRQ